MIGTFIARGRECKWMMDDLQRNSKQFLSKIQHWNNPEDMAIQQATGCLGSTFNPCMFAYPSALFSYANLDICVFISKMCYRSLANAAFILFYIHLLCEIKWLMILFLLNQIEKKSILTPGQSATSQWGASNPIGCPAPARAEYKFPPLGDLPCVSRAPCVKTVKIKSVWHRRCPDL